MAASTDNSLQAALRKERDAIQRSYPGASPEVLQQAWLRRKAQLLSTLDDDTDASRPHNVPRSISFGGPIGSRQPFGAEVSEPLDRTGNNSTQSAPADMLATDIFPNMAGFNNGSLFGSDGLAMAEWDDTFPAYTIGSGNNPSKAPMPFNTPPLEVYVNPADFVQTLPDQFCPRPVQTTAFDPAQPFIFSASFGCYSPTQTHSAPNTPTSIELTPCSTLTSGMSRENSTTDSSTNGGSVDMRRLQSAMSFSDARSRENSLTFPFNVSESSDSQFPSSVVCSSVSYGASAPYSSSLSQSDSHEGMKRSDSVQSVASGTSTHSRSLQRKAEVLASSTRPIAPKGALESEMTQMSRQSSEHKMMRIKSQDGSTKDVAQIPKATYIRPQHPKITCPHCNEYPDGFRGEHELRRHVDRKHAKVKKVWVTVDASTNQLFLANCKQCRNQKQYGAYYNAAAHLRRAHFHPRKRGRKGKHDSEKRGGKGGGDDPPMDYLKQHWMKEIEVIVSDEVLASNSSSEMPEDVAQEISTTRDIPYNFTQSHAIGGNGLPQLSTPQLPLPAVEINAANLVDNTITIYPQVDPTSQMSEYFAFTQQPAFVDDAFNPAFGFPNQQFDAPMYFDMVQ